eukprot:CCRYP_015240-RA/>CCRYP_015240-RA protein AED:0.47 eAED:0.47 QI:0/-1/0/1/-1/1/1/0/113
MAKWLFQKPPTHAVAWFHYLQHPDHRLEETLDLSMYWKGLKRQSNHIKSVTQLPGEQAQAIKIRETATKTITNPWEALCVDLIGPYTLKGKDKTQIDFMCVTMIDPQQAGLKL